MKKKTIGVMTLLEKAAKIEKLPQTVRDSLPFIGFTHGGIIENSPGRYNKTYHLPDVNFKMASIEEQIRIAQSYGEFLDAFDKSVRWQFTIYNHRTDKKSTMEAIRIPPQRDSINRLRSEANSIMLSSMQGGTASYTQDKYITVAVDDINEEHAIKKFNNIDIHIGEHTRQITGSTGLPLTTKEKMQLLYSIYNPSSDYRLSTGIFENEETFDLSVFAKQGLSIKDVIGPGGDGFNFAPAKYFMLGDTYVQGFYMDHVKSSLTTDFIANLSEIQSDMLISIHYETMPNDKVNTMVKAKLASIEGRAAKVNKEHLQEGYVGALPPELEAAQDGARSLMDDINRQSQSIYFITLTVVTFSPTKEKMEETEALIKSLSGNAPLRPLKNQQEFVFNTALPLCRNDIFTDILQPTDSATVFLPFNSQELNQRNAIFYGTNYASKNMVLYDRMSGNNYNGLIFGGPGSGKSMEAKWEMLMSLLKYSDTQIFVIDPQGEYAPIVNAVNGQEIKLSPGTSSHINPLDLNLADEDEDSDIISTKIDYVTTLFKMMAKGYITISPVHITIIDKCLRQLYRPYVEELQREGKDSDETKCPTLVDVYQLLNLMITDYPDARDLVDVLYPYTLGAFNTFAHRTNVKTNARFVVYNTRGLGTNMKEFGLYICLSDIWNRMILNSQKNIYTRFYIDEFHILLESEDTTKFLKRIWKMARKWLGVPTGITQNTDDLLRDKDTLGIFNTTSFIIMLKMPTLDCQNLGALLKLSDSQLAFLENPPKKGYGLLYNGSMTISFGNEIPHDTELYNIMSTAHDTKPLKGGAA